EFYRFQDAVLFPKPVQRPHPPFLLGGNGRGLLRLAARHADELNIISGTGRTGYIALAEVSKLTDESFRAKVRFAREEAARLGRHGDDLRLPERRRAETARGGSAAAGVAAAGPPPARHGAAASGPPD